MRKSLAIIGVLAFASPVGRADERNVYRVELVVYRVDKVMDLYQPLDEMFQRHSGPAPDSPSPVVGVLDGVVADRIRLELPGIEIKNDNDVLLVKGLSESARFTSPAVTVVEGDDAEIRMQSEPVQYMTRDADGYFTLHEFDTFTGAAFRVRVTPSKESGMVRMKWSYELHRVIGREELNPPVNLDIGMPRVAQERFESGIDMKPGQWITAIQRSGDAAILMAFVHVVRSDEGRTR